MQTSTVKYIMITLLVISVILPGCVVIPTYTGHISLKSLDKHFSDGTIQNVAILGSGKIPSEIFLENLSEEMIPEFKKHNVRSEFLFFEKNDILSKQKLDSLVTGPFDSFLIFKSANDTYLDLTKGKFIFAAPGISGTAYGNQYSETFTLTLYQKKESFEILWQGELVVDFDIANQLRYQKIKKLIFKEFVKRNLLRI